MVLVFHASVYQLAHVNELQGLGLLVFTGVKYLWLGVPMFFVISGYCISATCDSARRKPQSVTSYLTRRYRRIFPPFWITTALSVALVAATQSLGGASLFVDAVHPLPLPFSLSFTQWIGNLTLTETFRQHCGGGPSAFFLGHAWSLCYEEQFYVVCGLLLFAAPKRFFCGASIVSALVIATNLIALQLGLNISGFFFDGRWLMFSIGIFVYWALNYAQGPSKRLAHYSAFAASALAVAAAAYGPIRIFLLPSEYRLELAIAIVFGTLLLFLRRFDDSIMGSRLLAAPILCGTMCYSLYLVHWPVVKLLASASWTLGIRSWPSTLLVTVPICAAASILVAWPFHLLVERRFMNTSRSLPLCRTCASDNHTLPFPILPPTPVRHRITHDASLPTTGRAP